MYNRQKSLPPLYRDIGKGISLAILFLAFGLRVWKLDAQSLWHDEGLSWWFARQPLWHLLSHVAGTEHPPFYFLILGGWMRLSGDSVYALRFLSVLGGTLTVALLIRLAEQWRLVAAGLLAAFFLTWNPFHIWYSQEVRSYAWLPFLALWLTIEARRWEKNPGFREGLFYGAIAGLSLYVHPFIAFLILSQAVYNVVQLLRRPTGRRAILQTLFPYGISTLLFLPWIMPTLSQLHTNRTYFYWGTIDLSKEIQKTAMAFAYYPLPDTIRPLFVPRGAFLLWILAVIGSIIVFHVYKGKWLLLSVWPPLIITLFVAFIWPKYAPRYVIYVLPVWFLLVSITILAPVHVIRKTQEGILACMAGTFLALFLTGYGITAWYARELTDRPEVARPNFRDPVTFLAEKAQPGDAIFLVGGHVEPIVRYYMRRKDVLLEPFPRRLLLDLGTPLRWETVATTFNRTTVRHPRIWGVFWQEELADPQRLVYSTLSLYGCALLPVGLTPDVDIGLFVVPRPLHLPSTPTPTYPIGISFRNGLRLEGLHAARLFSSHTSPDLCFQDRQQPHRHIQVAAGETLYVVLLFRPQHALSQDLMGFVHLVNREGNKAFALDDRLLGGYVYPVWRWPPGDVIQQTFQLRLPHDLPAGIYALEIGLYHPHTLQRVDPLPGTSTRARVDGSRILYGPIEVLPP